MVSELDSATHAFVEFVNAQGAPRIETIPTVEARKAFDDLEAVPVEKVSATVEQITLPGPAGEVSISIVRPANAEHNLPVIMYFHGGGCILGNYDSHERLVREIANGGEAAVVFVDLAFSEAAYPVAIEQAYAALRFIAERGGEFDLDGSRLAVGGDSAGGYIATGLALLAKQRGGPRIRSEVLFSPMADEDMAEGSYEEFEQGPLVLGATAEWFWDADAPDVSPRAHWRMSSPRTSHDQTRRLPTTPIKTAESDVTTALDTNCTGSVLDMAWRGLQGTLARAAAA